eukprot:scaffold178627_cov23-Tisochrysis_lutea.AAC.1
MDGFPLWSFCGTRNARVFSIDPPTARDLDDAMHVEPVEGVPGRWRVGVHIADVSHFIPPDRCGLSS